MAGVEPLIGRQAAVRRAHRWALWRSLVTYYLCFSAVRALKLIQTVMRDAHEPPTPSLLFRKNWGRVEGPFITTAGGWVGLGITPPPGGHRPPYLWKSA